VIGGTDIVIPARANSESIDACARIIREYWPEVTFENALTGEQYLHYKDLPFGQIKELLVYPNRSAQEAWDRGDESAPTNSMMQILLSPTNVTLVVDDPRADQMCSILESIRECLVPEFGRVFTEAA
jgi:hypothetical protein